MHFLTSPTFLLAITAALASIPTKATPLDIPANNLPFAIEHLFTVELFIGKPLSPIPEPGGVLLVEPFIGGKVFGKALNATINGGVAYPSVLNNQTLQVPIIDAWGITSDNQSFYIHGSGIGTSLAQSVRIELSIGGAKYEALNNGFIIGSLNINANRTVSTVQGYMVQNIAK